MSRYNVYTDEKSKVIVTSTYAGRTVRGIAKCAPGDVFNVQTGETLAQARCDLKVSEKRLLNAINKLESAFDERDRLDDRINDLNEYYLDSLNKYREAQSQLKKIEESIS